MRMLSTFCLLLAAGIALQGVYLRTQRHIMSQVYCLHSTAITGALGAAILSVLLFGTGPVNAQAITTCSGVEVTPGNDLAAVAAAHDAGTNYCINDGSYSVAEPIVVQTSDSFVGVYSDGSRPEVRTDVAEHIFYYPVGEHDALISGLDVSGAKGGDYCEPNCGRGIGGPGRNLTVENVRSRDNQNQGIGGMGPGLVIRDSELDHNGTLAFTAADAGAGEPSSAAGVKSVNSMTITGSYVHDNFWNGIWCDSYRDGLSVQNDTYIYAQNNVVKNNGKLGISDEVCTTARISGNRVIHNGHNPVGSTTHSGILVYGSLDAKVFDNTVRRNKNYGIKLLQGKRSSSMTAYVHDNILSGNQINLSGCSLAGVTCKRNK
jgi:hypothetical protein